MDESENSRNKVKEFNEKIKAISEKLELTNEQKIIDIEFVENIKLGGNLERNSIFVVKIKDKDGSMHHIVIDKDANKIATIDKDGKVELSDREKKMWEQYIGKPNEQRLDQKNIYDFDKEYILEEYKTNDKKLEKDEKEKSIKKEQKEEKNKEEQEKQEKDKNKEEKEVAKALNIKTDTIICIVKIEDRETFGQAINKKLKSDSYIVQYGNNKTKIMETTTGNLGDLKEVSGLEYSEFTSEVLEQLNVPERGKDLKIKPGDLKTIRDKEKGCSYVVVRENDPDKGIVIVSSQDGIKTYTFNDKDKDSIEELKESIIYTIETGKEKKDIDDEKQKIEEDEEQEEIEKEEDEDEGRTPWGDAYARQRR